MSDFKTKKLTAKEQEDFLEVLQVRFEKNKNRHPEMEWVKVKAKLISNPKKMESLFAMEITEGEPDVVAYLADSNEYVFFDCAAESPKGRRSFCYDQEALDSRKEHKPKNSAITFATEMGVEIVTEEDYRALQKLGQFDTKTSSWIHTPNYIRKLGGAIFADFRYDTVFVYHNGASSYYAARGFRAKINV